MKSCLMITGGELNLDFARNFIKDKTYRFVIAVDAGLSAALALGLRPDAAVGDFDTVDEAVLNRFRSMEGAETEEHKPEKDETDTELAFRAAIRSGCTDITVLGATGGRMDHAVGNIHLLYACLKQGVRACIVDEKNRIRILDGPETFRRKELWGKYISFLPLTEEVRGITLTGFKYPLHEKNISIGTSLCISNELAKEQGSLEFTSGVLICVESHD